MTETRLYEGRDATSSAAGPLTRDTPFIDPVFFFFSTRAEVTVNPGVRTGNGIYLDEFIGTIRLSFVETCSYEFQRPSEECVTHKCRQYLSRIRV